MVIRCNYENALHLHGGYYAVSYWDKCKSCYCYNVIDRFGKLLSEEWFRDVVYFTTVDDKAYFLVQRGSGTSRRYNIMDINGAIMFDEWADSISSPMSYGYSMLRNGNKCIIFDKDFNIVHCVESHSEWFLNYVDGYGILKSLRKGSVF